MTDTTSGGLTDASASTQLDAGASVTTETGSAGLVDASGSTSVDTTVAPVDTGATLTDTTSSGLAGASVSTQLGAGASVTDPSSGGMLDTSVSTQLDTSVAPVDAGVAVTDTSSGGLASDVSGAVAPVVGSVDQPLADVTGAVAPVVGSVDQPLADVTGAVAPVVGSVDQPLADVTGAVAPVVGSVDQPLADVTGAVAPVVGSVDQPVTDVTGAVAPVVGSIDQPVADVAGATAPVVGSVDQPLADLTSTAAPVLGSVDQPLADVSGATAPVVAGADASLTQDAATAAGVAGLPAPTDMPAAATGGPAAALADPHGSPVAGGPPDYHPEPPLNLPAVALAHEVGPGATHDGAVALPPPDSPIEHPGIDPYTPPPDGISTADDGGASITQILGTGYVAWKLAIFAALLTSLTRWSANATGCLSSVRLVTFTNVQLIRCGLVSPIVQMASASTAAVSQLVGTVGSTPVRAPVDRVRAGAARGMRAIVSLPKEAVRHGLGGDGSLMMRIGKLLGLLYGAFLTVWFWATRLRWNGK